MKRRVYNKLQRGQGGPEYAIVIALVAIAGVLVLGVLGLALSSQYGLLGGALGVKKDIQTPKYYIFFDSDKPQCGQSGGVTGLYAQFFSDIDKQYLSVTTDIAGVAPSITDNNDVLPGIGNYVIQLTLTDGTPCPTAIVIQSDKEHGGLTVVWNVLKQDW